MFNTSNCDSLVIAKRSSISIPRESFFKETLIAISQNEAILMKQLFSVFSILDLIVFGKLDGSLIAQINT
jgi:hypothetical protein